MQKNHNTILRRLQEKKNRNYILAASLDRLGIKNWAPLVRECGNYIGIAEDEGGKPHIMEANFCTHRLCPTCNWRRGLKIYANTSKILDYIDAKSEGVKYLFLTLTVRNVQLPDLGAEIDRMSEAFKRLINNRAWKTRVLGAMRTLEITINHETNTVHPHYHLILAVPSDYGKRSNPLYWNHAQWQAAWKKAARLEYDPQVSIELVKGRKKGVAEVAKYMAKDSDYLIDATKDEMGTEEAEALTDWLVGNLCEQLKGRRLVSYTGILWKAQRALKLTDPETGPLTDTIRGDIACAIKRYHWNAGLGCYQPYEKYEPFRDKLAHEDHLRREEAREKWEEEERKRKAEEERKQKEEEKTE